MVFIYDTKNKVLKNVDKSTEVYLQELECRFLEVIINGSMNSWREIAEYVDKYDYYKDAINYISAIKLMRRNLVEKTKLNIIDYYGRGIILLDSVRVI